MTKKMYSGADSQDQQWEELLQESLWIEEEPPQALQAELISKIRDRKPAWRLPYWIPAVAGGLQSAGLIIAVQLMLPGSLLAQLSIVGGSILMASAVLLTIVARVLQKGKEDGETCY
ncbi:hypothetical protein A7K91_07360 [Paenibacillus oryzae]|uniref:Uncharacterized protein n=1 Tax=Paenibacillus oryzae TaxID=1844972 RepID=A0A1A5YM12_9BACL|nr:hypothetical protein [Paenibacillus oryzae]OBR66664.1 hypothetical protein A7K91_07360 [Paenibacillus oryzae]